MQKGAASELSHAIDGTILHRKWYLDPRLPWTANDKILTARMLGKVEVAIVIVATTCRGERTHQQAQREVRGGHCGHLAWVARGIFAEVSERSLQSGVPEDKHSSAQARDTSGGIADTGLSVLAEKLVTSALFVEVHADFLRVPYGSVDGSAFLTGGDKCGKASTHLNTTAYLANPLRQILADLRAGIFSLRPFSTRSTSSLCWSMSAMRKKPVSPPCFINW